MKKRKLLLLPLALLCATSLTACNKGGDETSSSTATSTTSSVSGSSSATSSSAHEHEYAKDWSKDATNHWHADTCGHKTKKDVAAHTFVWGKCTVCGYTKVYDGFKYTFHDKDENYDDEYYIIDSRTDTTNMTGEVVIPGNKDDSSTPVVMINDATMINKGVFENCTGITTLVISENIKIIGANTFKGCTGIKTIVIPTSLKKVGNDAFSGCTGIESIYYFASTSEWGDIDQGTGNDVLFGASEKWYYYSEKEPTTYAVGTHYWHYDDEGNPTEWVEKK